MSKHSAALSMFPAVDRGKTTEGNMSARDHEFKSFSCDRSDKRRVEQPCWNFVAVKRGSKNSSGKIHCADSQ